MPFKFRKQDRHFHHGRAAGDRRLGVGPDVGVEHTANLTNAFSDTSFQLSLVGPPRLACDEQDSVSKTSPGRVVLSATLNMKGLHLNGKYFSLQSNIHEF